MYRQYDDYDRDDYDRDDYDEPSCLDRGCDGCEGCIRESGAHTRHVIARKARRNIQPGDRVAVVSGFTYQIGGPRLGYYKRKSVVGYGPLHGPTLMGTGRWPEGLFAQRHPGHAAFVESRDALMNEADEIVKTGGDFAAWELRLDAWEAEHGTWERANPDRYARVGTWTRESLREAKATEDAKRAQQEAWRQEGADRKAMVEAVKAAEDGDTITYDGATWTVGSRYAAMHWFSSMEYNGHLCDGESRWYRTLTNTETGVTKKVRV